MDNTVPPVIKDFAGKSPEKIPGLNFLSFRDWLASEDHLSTDWTMIYQSNHASDETDLATISCFASPPTKESRGSIFQKHDWDIDNTFGIPFVNAPGSDHWEYDLDVSEFVDDVCLTPFVTYRHFYSYAPPQVDIVQHFIYYHRAFWNAEKQEFHMIDEDGELHTLIRYRGNLDSALTIHVNTRYLRNYLALTNNYLVRFHDFRRHYKDKMPFDHHDFSHVDDLRSYRINVRNDRYLKPFQSFSRLLGKDIIEPFSKPWEAEEEDSSEHITFVYGVDANGKNIEYTCDEDALSSYFTDVGAPNFLTPVYFKKTVLQKYYSESRRYTVSASELSCLSLWSVPIDITNEGLIQVWLGDLCKLPLKEQMHWKQYNVPPQGTITKHRFERDFEAKFSGPSVEESPMSHLIGLYQNVNEYFLKRFGDRIFLELDKNDQHHSKGLRIPLSDEWGEFDEQIQSLAKIFSDSLNVKLLQKISGKKMDGNEIKGSIALLYVTLDTLGLPENSRNNLIESLQAIQAIRSSGAAHRKGSQFEKSLEKYGLNNLPNDERVKLLSIKLHNSLLDLISQLEIVLNPPDSASKG